MYTSSVRQLIVLELVLVLGPEWQRYSVLEGCGPSQPSLEALKNDGAKRLAPSRDSACNGIRLEPARVDLSPKLSAVPSLAYLGVPLREVYLEMGDEISV
jgi:hypothetical protein